MADDVIFMVPVREPFGKEQFRTASERMKNVRMAGTSDIREIKVLGDWAYIRNYIEITVMPPDGTPMQRRDTRSRSFASNLMENGPSGGTRI